MENHILNIETVIDYIESHLDEKLDLEKVSEAVHYSKYHLHRMFTNTVGMTIHDYVQRRQLTEAAKLLVFSSKPIIEIAFSVVMKASKHLHLPLNLCIKYHLLSIGIVELFIRCSSASCCIRIFHPKFLRKMIFVLQE